jgi:hypothetical protein
MGDGVIRSAEDFAVREVRSPARGLAVYLLGPRSHCRGTLHFQGQQLFAGITRTTAVPPASRSLAPQARAFGQLSPRCGLYARPEREVSLHSGAFAGLSESSDSYFQRALPYGASRGETGKWGFRRRDRGLRGMQQIRDAHVPGRGGAEIDGCAQHDRAAAVDHDDNDAEIQLRRFRPAAEARQHRDELRRNPQVTRALRQLGGGSSPGPGTRSQKHCSRNEAVRRVCP